MVKGIWVFWLFSGDFRVLMVWDLGDFRVLVLLRVLLFGFFRVCLGLF